MDDLRWRQQQLPHVSLERSPKAGTSYRVDQRGGFSEWMAL
ncbi:hypothetical protein SSAG_00462 [Streptomyces sp. Mg1]|nr:hypothetical protein SSAG_00462 [Streptomyces sp. Mg1]